MNNEDALYSLNLEFANPHLTEGATGKRRRVHVPKFH
jgi:hypothetical protein